MAALSGPRWALSTGGGGKYGARDLNTSRALTVSEISNALHSLWIGGSLGWLEQLCLTSWMAEGHDAVLWTYETVTGVPLGVELRDAREVVPQAMVTRHRKTGSPALFANYFRYKLLSLFPVTWLDTDAYLIRPLPRDRAYLMGRQSPTEVNNGVLRLPADSPVLRDLLDFYLSPAPIPFWYPAHQTIRYRLRALFGFAKQKEDFGWGTFGPGALTAYTKRHGVFDLSLPVPALYPVPWDQTALFAEPPETMARYITEETLSVHLWGRPIRNGPYREGPPAGSWLAGELARHGIRP